MVGAPFSSGSMCVGSAHLSCLMDELLELEVMLSSIC